MADKHVVHLYLEPKEFEFLQVCAKKLKLSYAQTILYLADFDNRIEEYNRPLPPDKVARVQGIDFTNAPLDEY